MNDVLVFVETSAGGTGMQAVRIAQDMGVEVVFCAADLRFFRELDGGSVLELVRTIQVDAYDAGAVIEELENRGVRPTGVLALDDYHLGVAADVAAHFDAPGHARSAIALARRKDLVRQRLHDEGVRQPGFTVVQDVADLESLHTRRRRVVKPVDDSGGVAVKIVEDPSALREAVRAVLSRERNSRGYDLSRVALVEDHVEGPEFSAELLHDGRRWLLLGFTTKELGGVGGTVEVAHAFPAVLPADPTTVGAQIVNWLTALGLSWGAAHVEFRLVGETPIPIEINPRLAGGRIPSIIEVATGRDVIAEMIRLALARPVGATHFRRSRGGAIRFVLPSGPGTVVAVRNLPEADLNAYDFVLSGVNHTLPRTVGEPRSNYDQLAYVVCAGACAADAQERADARSRDVEIVYRDRRC